MALLLPNRWQRQPQGPVEIDWSHPLARGLTGFWIFNTITPINLVTGEKSVQSAATGHVITTTQKASKRMQIGGMSLKLSSSRRSLLADSQGSVLHFCGGMSEISGNAYRRGFSSKDYIGYNHHNGSSLSGTRIFFNGVSSQLVSSVQISAEKRLVFSYSPSGVMIYQNGVLNASNNTAINIATDADFSIGNSSGVSSEEPLYPNELLATWDRRLTAREVYELNKNPYALLRPIRRTYPADLSFSNVTESLDSTLPAPDIDFNGLTLGAGDLLESISSAPPAPNITLQGAAGVFEPVSLNIAASIELKGGNFTTGRFTLAAPTASITLSGLVGNNQAISQPFNAPVIEIDGNVGSYESFDLTLPGIDVSITDAPTILLTSPAPEITFNGVVGVHAGFSLNVGMDSTFTGTAGLAGTFELPIRTDIAFDGKQSGLGEFDLNAGVNISFGGYIGLVGGLDLTMTEVDIDFAGGQSPLESFSLTMPAVNITLTGINSSVPELKFYNRYTR